MRRKIGLLLLALSFVVGVVLLATRQMGSERVTRTAGGVNPIGGWHVTEVEFDPNWAAVIPVAACFLIGLCFVLVRRRQPPAG
jgi:hypothetical protein